MRYGWIVPVLLMLSGCAGQAERDAAENRQKQSETHVRLGLGYMQQGNLELALSKLQRAVELDPKYAAAHNALALLYEQVGKNVLAEDHYRKAVSLKPEEGAPQNNFGAFLCKRQRYDEADRHFVAAAADPFYSTPELAYENAGLCALRAPDAARAEARFREALRLKPNLPVTLLEMARLSFSQERYLQARAYLQRYEDVATASPDMLWLGVRVERQLGARDKAAHYERALKEKFPGSEQAQQLNSAGKEN